MTTLNLAGLHQVRFLVLVTLISGAIRVSGAECSLVVKVVDTNGTAVHAWVGIDESAGRHVEKRHAPGGVRFCDLGIRPARITVTPISSGCSWSVSMKVDLSWDKTSQVFVTVPAEECQFRPSALVLGQCGALFRVMKENGEWLPTALVSVTSNAAQSSSKADEFGRVMFRNFPLDSVLQVTVSAEGFSTRTLEVACSTDKLEQMVELRPR